MKRRDGKGDGGVMKEPEDRRGEGSCENVDFQANEKWMQ